MKVKDLIKQLEDHNPESDVVLKERDGRVIRHHRDIRAYFWQGRVQIDGYNPD